MITLQTHQANRQTSWLHWKCFLHKSAVLLVLEVFGLRFVCRAKPIWGKNLDISNSHLQSVDLKQLSPFKFQSLMDLQHYNTNISFHNGFVVKPTFYWSHYFHILCLSESRLLFVFLVVFFFSLWGFSWECAQKSRLRKHKGRTQHAEPQHPDRGPAGWQLLKLFLVNESQLSLWAKTLLFATFLTRNTYCAKLIIGVNILSVTLNWIWCQWRAIWSI